MKPRLAERHLVALVRSGEWSIDDDGRVWRIAVRLGNRWHPGVVSLSPCTRRRVEKRLPSGYLMVRASIDGRRVVGLAHRLVWQAAHGDIAEGLVVNHRSGVKDDNRLANLETVSPSENTKHAYRIGLKDEHGERNPHARISDHDVALIRNAYASGAFTMEKLAERHGCSVQHVSSIVRGKRRVRQAGPIAADDQRVSLPVLDGRQHAEFPT